MHMSLIILGRGRKVVSCSTQFQKRTKVESRLSLVMTLEDKDDAHKSEVFWISPTWVNLHLTPVYKIIFSHYWHSSK